MSSIDPPAPLPEQVTFDYWEHEYWRLATVFKELAEWESELERRERALIRKQSHHRRGGSTGRWRGNGGSQRYTTHSNE